MSQQKKIKIGVIGAGHIAQVAHIPQWSKLENVDIVAVSDIQPSKAKWVAEKFNIKQYGSDPQELLDNPEIDAIDICTDTASHKDLAIAALAAGKHVLVEKPMARTFSEAKEMAAAAEKYQRHLMVAMNVRFRRDAIILKSFIDGDELGDVFYIKTGWLIRRDLSNTEDSWFYNKELSGGGVLMDLGIQMLDVAWWLMGNRQPVSVKTVIFAKNQELQVEDSATCLIHFKDNSVLTLEVSWTMLTEKERFYVNVFGTKGSAQINPLRVFKDMHGNLINIIPSREENSILRYKRSYKNELKHFVNCIQNKATIQAGASEIAQRLQLIETMYRSAAEGKEVKI